MKKKTLGILTFNRASNYGAILQAHALKDVCESLGYETHIVNYTKGIPGDEPTPLQDFRAAPNKKRAVIKLGRALLGYTWNKKRWNAFCDFRKNFLSESPVCNTAEDVAALGYDVYIAGSDQIWNYNITGKEFDPVYFGDFETDANCIVYAASSHDTPFPLDKELEFREKLAHSKAHISIREQKLASYVETLTGTSHPVVLDPTLLAGSDWLNSLTKTAAPKERYILIYQIDANPATDVSVKALEKRFGCKVYTMTTPRIGSLHGRRGTAGPEAFLALLKNAEFLVTNSFHGIALSLLLEKEFFVYENGGVMTRINSLLSSLGLENRKIKMVADIAPEQKIPYESVKPKLSAQRQSSMQFLKDALAGKRSSYQAQKQEASSLQPLRERKKDACSGCCACADACPVNAISMEYDEEGFLYPRIDETHCIHCGLCDKVCGFKPKAKQDGAYALPKAYGIKHKDEQTRSTSRSGAAFVAFSDIILKRGGVVYGAAMMEDHSVRHIRASTSKERDKMKTAKYVQSDVQGIFPQVAADLTSGKNVLFSGTPCQVSGLLAMLEAKRVDQSKLVCCDLVCHGVPSPKLWKDYLHHVEEKYGKKIQTANFRDKSFGWDSHCESFVLENGKKIVSRDYTDLFYEHIMFRPSCHNCQFANVNRVADLTLADFWGIEKNDATFNDNRGVSLVLVSSAKGAGLLEEAKDALHWFACDVKNCMQPTLVKPSAASPLREAFWRDYKAMRFPTFVKKYTTPLSFVPRNKRRMKQILYRLKLRKHP